MAFDFSGKKVLVTGAARGIGRGIALALAIAGCKVYALDINKENLAKLATQSSSIVYIHQDLSNWDDTRSALDNLEVMDGLVNNAAINQGPCPALQHSTEDLDKYMSVNLFAYINCIQIVGNKMVQAGRKGSIVNMSSVLSLAAWPGLLGYSVAKAGVEMVTKQFALELGPLNIRVNAVNPTLVETDMKDTVADAAGRMLERTPMPRYDQIDDVVGPVLYLLSDYSVMVTGTTNLVDGGLLCNITTKQ